MGVSLLELLGLLYGIATFYGVKKLSKPIKHAAVMTTGQMFNVLDRGREVAYNVKEDFEDIIAEAHYENMKSKHALFFDDEEGGE